MSKNTNTDHTWRLPLMPQPALLWAAVALTIAAVLMAIFAPSFSRLWWSLLGVCVAAATIDALRGRMLPTPKATRLLADNWSLGVATKIQLQLRHTAKNKQALKLHLHDWHPEGCVVEHAEQALTLPTNQTIQLEYSATAHSRGRIEFTGVELHLQSPWRLWQLRRFIDLPHSVRVLPKFTRIAHYRLLATANRLSDLGVLKQARRGSGLEFHQLREYRQGDSLRQVHWQASAAQNKLISKEYEDERNQQVIFMLDASRRMRHQDSNESLLDEALNSALLLSHVALNQGDAVGMMSMAHSQRWLPPRTGTGVVAHLMNHFYDIEAEPVAADYLAAAQTILTRQKKRALIVIITNTRNEDFKDLYAALSLLRKKHLVVLTDLREKLLTHLIDQPLNDIDQAVHFHAAHQYLEQRWKQHAQLRHHGIKVLDVEATQLPPALVSQYLQIKETAQI